MTSLPWERAAQRVDFSLTYARTERRTLFPNEMQGPDLPDAYGSDRPQVGEWSHDTGPDEEDPQIPESDWLAHFASMAVAEAVHEALEWFHVDGKPWLDPHGAHEFEIHELVEHLNRGLAALVEKDSEP